MKLKKWLKLLLILVGVVGIPVVVSGYFIIKLIDPPPPPPPENQYTKRIEGKIDTLGKNAFSRESYNEVASLINNYHNDHNFSKESDEDNDRWNGIFVRRLFDTYTTKFLSYAYTVYKSQEWKEDDLNRIKDEYQEIKKAEIVEKGEQKPLLQPNSPMDSLLKDVQEVRRTYDNINGFIATCANFSYSGVSFPIVDIKDKLATAVSYRYKVFKLKNETFPLCGRTKKKLEEVPQVLFNKHVAFLNNKIVASMGRYDGYGSQAEYQSTEWKTVKSEIDGLDRSVYGVDSIMFERQYAELREKWNAEIPRAMKYFEYRDMIIKYMNGDALDRDKLKEYKDINKYGTSKKLVASLDLCLEIWNLNGTNGKTYKDLLEKISADDNIKYSKLRSSLYQIRNETRYSSLPKKLILN